VSLETTVGTTQIAIVGAGVGGMAAAIKLAESGYRVAVYDPAPAAGGLAGGFTIGGGSVDRFTTTSSAAIKQPSGGLQISVSAPNSSFYRRPWGFLAAAGSTSSEHLSLLQFKPLPFVDRLRLGLRIRAIGCRVQEAPSFTWGATRRPTIQSSQRLTTPFEIFFLRRPAAVSPRVCLATCRACSGRRRRSRSYRQVGPHPDRRYAPACPAW
jgi:hypothetical protein